MKTYLSGWFNNATEATLISHFNYSMHFYVYVARSPWWWIDIPSCFVLAFFFVCWSFKYLLPRELAGEGLFKWHNECVGRAAGRSSPLLVGIQTQTQPNQNSCALDLLTIKKSTANYPPQINCVGIQRVELLQCLKSKFWEHCKCVHVHNKQLLKRQKNIFSVYTVDIQFFFF